MLSVGFPSDSKTFDPTYSVQFTERQVLYVIYNTLVRYGTDFSLQPELAESWNIEDDGKRIVFKLRRGVKFHDGTDFNAEAVKWNIEHRLDKEVASPQRQQLDPIIASVEVIDPTTVAFNLKQRSPGLLSLLGERPGFMISPTAAQEVRQGLRQQSGRHRPVRVQGMGEAAARSRSSATRTTGKRASPISTASCSATSPARSSARSGSRPASSTSSATCRRRTILQLQNRPGIELHPITVGRWYSLQWHMYEPPFDNAKLRQAIAHGIDRKRINDIVMAGKGALFDGPTPRGPVVVRRRTPRPIRTIRRKRQGAARRGRLSERLRIHAVDAADRRAAADQPARCRSSSPRSASS